MSASLFRVDSLGECEALTVSPNDVGFIFRAPELTCISPSHSPYFRIMHVVSNFWFHRLKLGAN